MIGILLYSMTGNTLQVAKRLQAALAQKGQSTEIARITADQTEPNRPAVHLLEIPDPLVYDKLIFAAPVNGFQLAQAMKLYLAQMPDLAGRPACVLVTQHLKRSWMGGNKAVSQIRQSVSEHGSTIQATAIVHWSDRNREGQITAAIDTLVGALQE